MKADGTTLDPSRPHERRRRDLTAVHLLALAAAVLGAWLASVSPLAPWAVLLAGALAYVVIARPQLFMLVLIALLPWQGALRFPTHDITIVKLVGVLLFVSVALSTLLADRRLRLTPPVLCAVALCVTVTLSAVVNGSSGLSATETLRYWSLALFLFLMVQLIDSHAALMRAIRVLALSAIVGALWASVQFLSGSAQRASGPISDPNDFAYFLAVMLPFVIYLFMSERSRRRLWGLGLTCLALGILSSSSRGALVALVVAVAWGALSGRISLGAILGGLALVVVLVLLALGLSSAKTAKNLEVRQHSLSTNVDLRRSYWSAALRMTADHPLLGIGPGRFEALSPEYVRNTPVREREVAVNNTYLALLAETGLPALLLFLSLLGLIGRQILLLGARRPRGPTLPIRAPERWLGSALQASFIIAVVGAIFFSAQLSTPIWFIAAIASALSAQACAPAGEPC